MVSFHYILFLFLFWCYISYQSAMLRAVECNKFKYLLLPLLEILMMCGYVVSSYIEEFGVVVSQHIYTSFILLSFLMKIMVSPISMYMAHTCNF